LNSRRRIRTSLQAASLRRRRCAPQFDSSRLNGDSSRRAAFTIFELLIVLGVLVLILGLSWPVLENYQSQYRLRQGGQLVQTRLSAARVASIDTGFVYQFRYEPGGQRFVVLPFDQQALLAQPVAGKAGPRKIAGKLPSAKAKFGSSAVGGQQVPGEWLTGIAAAGEFSGVSWSAPILFYPDGSASAATLAIGDKKSHIVSISVRPLTGAISVSKIEKGTLP
jgi:Tfp pilus assembly protein FimT